MKTIIALLAAVSLTGCVSTYSELQQEQPALMSATSKSPEAFVECVLPKWMDEVPAAHVIQQGDARTIVAPNGAPAAETTFAILTATPNASGSDISYRVSISPNRGWAKKMGQQAQSCL